MWHAAMQAAPAPARNRTIVLGLQYGVGQAVAHEIHVGVVAGQADAPISGLGQERTSAVPPVMSALPPKTDIERRTPNVRF